MEELRYYIDQLYRQYIRKNDFEYMEIDGGNIIPFDEFEQLKTDTSAWWINEQAREPATIGIDSGVYVGKVKPPRRKPKTTKSYYDNGDFNMMYRKGQDTVAHLNLSLYAEYVYLKLSQIIVYPYNCVEIEKHQKPTFEMLAEYTKMSKRKFGECIAELQQNNVVQCVGAGYKTVIYINPTYIATGTNIEKDTLRLFGLYND